MIYYSLKNEEELNYYQNNLGYGMILKLTGNIEEFSNSTIFNTFSYKDYMFYHHIHYSFKTNNISIIKKPKGLYQLKTLIRKRIEKINNSEFLKAFILGEKDKLDTDIYNNNGVSHLLAVSGLHIILVINFLTIFLKKFKYSDLIILIIIWFYLFLLSFTVSAFRAVLFYTLKKINTYFNLNLKIAVLLIISFVVLLSLNPFYIYDIAFWYSYIVFLGIVLIKIDDSNKILAALKINGLAFFLTLPITASNFYQINILSIIYAYILGIYVSTILLPGTLITFIFPLFNSCLGLLNNIFIFLNNIFSHISLGIIVMPKVNIVWWIIYYLLLLIILYTSSKKGICLLIFLVLLIKITPNLDSNSYLYFLDVGQGDCMVFISAYHKEVMIVDVGGQISYPKEPWQTRKNNNYQVKNIITFLKSLGISKINYLVLSHGDYDHLGNSFFLVNNMKISQVIFNKGNYNNLELELINILKKKNLYYTNNIKELALFNTKITFFQTNKYDNENDNSNIVYLNNNGYQFLLMGDATTFRENDILNKYNISNIDVLKVGHHGSKTSSSKDFIEAIKPKYSIISVGKNNKYGHPNKEVLKNLANSKIYRTDLLGSIKVTINTKKFLIESYNK